MARKNKSDRKWYGKLRDKYRLVIMNNETYEERLSFRLSRLNVFLLTVTVSIILITLTIFIIAFTPIREYIPGYLDVNIPGKLYRLEQRADSLERSLRARDLYLRNIRNIIEGREIVDSIVPVRDAGIDYDSITIESSPEDSMLRAEYEARTKYNLFFYESEDLYDGALQISDIVFFIPVEGIIINKFNLAEKHYGVDIAASTESMIKSVQDGTIIFSDWTSETGHTIAIQHSGNFISLYKHNSTLLKSTGSFVKAGEPIAVSGDSGELTSGPHLHFELWHNGTPVDPEEYMTF
ncbi:MAG: M23 family peptidase [Bacteroidetes bacterium]|nr:MAG: M23 family peptidase [Bacteroidota bacterium]RLD79300.1 MAG: M23 family peptidase [Bacteroidota bacterium]